MLRLRVRAPFAAFRTFSAGSFRPTAPFLTPSAAYGFVLNLAGIESRLDDGSSPMTLMRPDLPSFDVAIGVVSEPEVQSIFQQLHNYPVGSSGQQHAAACRGAKYNIQPVRREFLSGIDACVGVRGCDAVENRVRAALRDGTAVPGDGGRPRYGIPFFGDNAFMVDVVREEDPPITPARWYTRIAGRDVGPVPGRCRLTIRIDRADMSRTVSGIFVPQESPTLEPPDAAWTRVGPE